jgi:pyruvate dehydrogenase E2 component (dihydrolipoamide acetyltransferase)
METGTIASWTLKEGDSFSAGDVLCSIETDKASVDFEAQDDGILAKILRTGSTAQDIPVGVPICVVVEDQGDVGAFADFVAEEAAPIPAPADASEPAIVETSVASTPSTTSPPTNRTVSDEFVLLPSARHLSQSKGIDATVLAGTGKGGRVTKGDVLQALADGMSLPPLAKKAVAAPAVASTAAAASAPVAPPSPKTLSDIIVPTIDSVGSYEDVPNNNMRKVIARRLTESKSQVPHYYTSMEIELDDVLTLRKQLAKNHDIKVSVNDVIIRSSALALRDVPEVNASYDPKTNKVTMQGSIDISVAVATPTGLITPIVPGTDRLGLAGIAAAVRDLAGRARDGKLQPHEYQGGTFCISNLGMFGIDEFSAVINPPQAAILAVGGGTPTVVPTPWIDGAGEQPSPKIKTIMTARLSADRRVVDEPTAALFMSALRHYLSNPELLIL